MWRRIRRRLAWGIGVTLLAGVLLMLSTSIVGWFGTEPVLLTAATDSTLVRDVTQLTAVRMREVIAPRTIEEIADAIRGSIGPISIGGGRYSMGGQTATPNGIQIDMRAFRGVLSLDTAARTISVRAGTTWREVQEAIDPHGLAVQVMQTYNTFTVGGALSVNAHGRYLGHGAVSGSVRSLRMVLASGDIVTASRTQRPDLFWAALGGYGGVGVIAEATLALAHNVKVRREDEVMPVARYREWFSRTIRGDTNVVFHNADITPGPFRELRAVTYRRTDAPLTVAERLRPRDQSGWVVPAAYALFTHPYGPWLRAHVIEPLAYRVGGRHPVTWRNYEASYDVSELEPPSRVRSTYVLQEFFVPVDSLERFVQAMASILRDSAARVVNVSIRHANAEPSPILTWAPVETYALVLYYRQGTSGEEQRIVGRWTRALIDAVIAHGGRYYLPYQPHATRAQFTRAYPRSSEFFAVKRRVDPQNRFANVLWDLYAPSLQADSVVTAARHPAYLPAEVRIALDGIRGYNRREVHTWTSHPAEDLAFSREQYAAWIGSGHPPGAFPYSAVVGTFWRSYDVIGEWTTARDDFPVATRLALLATGAGAALDYGLKSIHRGVFGRVGATRPWYEFTSTAPRGDSARWLVAIGTDSSIIPGLLEPRRLPRGYRALAVRQGAVRDALVALASDQRVQLVEMSGNQRIAVAGVAPRGWRAPPTLTPIMAYVLPTDSTRMRVVGEVRVPDLLPLLRGESGSRNGLRVDRVYGY